jgi:hydroxymethylpyrimidine pyrophosphatase-like HAD family hydrolase
MWFHVVAFDYDGTLATAGAIAPETMDALRGVRASGRRLVLVTGRQFDDLLQVCPEIRAFDMVVAENGGVLFDPRSGTVEDLTEPPPPAFLTALEAAAVPFSTGRSIVSSVVPHEVAILDAIKRLGLELHIVFNKEAVMVLRAGISKATGFRAALRRLGVSAHNAVGVGDGENDHAFLHGIGFAVAVANAVPALADAADLVTRSPNGAGVRELIAGPLANDFAAYLPHLLERTILLGEADDGTPVAHPARGGNLLVTGASAGETSAVAAGFVERLVQQDYVVCVLDPEGDCRTLAGHEGVVVIASEPGTEEKRAEEVDRLLRHRSTSVALDLSALGAEEQVQAAARLLRAVQRLRDETGAPHWVVIDDAHRLVPAGRPPPSGFTWCGTCLATSAPDRVAADVLATARRIVSTSLEAAAVRVPAVSRTLLDGGGLGAGEALDVSLGDNGVPRVRRFRLAGAAGARPGSGTRSTLARGDSASRGV